MPRTKGDGKQLYIGRKPRKPRRLTDTEWTEVIEQSQILPAKHFLSSEFRVDLDDAIDVFTSHGPQALKTLPMREVVKKIEAWTHRTAALKAELSRQVSTVSAGRAAPKSILKKYFSQDRYASDRATAEDLAFMMEGTIKLAHSILRRANKTSARRIEPIEYWLIWAALLISILRKHKIPFGRRTKSGDAREEFRSEVIDIIDLLQKKFPNLGWARNEPYSIRKALRVALPFARRENIQPLKRILRLWSAGDFDSYDDKELFRLHGINFSTKRILDRLAEAKQQLRTENRNTQNKSNMNSSNIS